MRIEAGAYDYKVPELTETMKEIQQLAKQIREKKIIMKEDSKINKQSTKPVMPRTAAARSRDRSVSRLRDEMEELGVDMENTENVNINNVYLFIKSIHYFRYFVRKKESIFNFQAHFTKTRKRSRSLSQNIDRKRQRLESTSRTRSVSRPGRDEMGIKDKVVSNLIISLIKIMTGNILKMYYLFQMKKKLKNIAHKAIKKKVAKKGLKGEADRFIGNKMPKHLFSGKRGSGKTDRR